MRFLLPIGVLASGGAAWKNLCRAACVFWAEAVQDGEGGPGLTGVGSTLSGAERTDEGRGAGWAWLAPFVWTADLAGPFMIPSSEETGLFGWAVQEKVPGFFPGL